jgi:hypothetical protein
MKWFAIFATISLPYKCDNCASLNYRRFLISKWVLGILLFAIPAGFIIVATGNISSSTVLWGAFALLSASISAELLCGKFISVSEDERKGVLKTKSRNKVIAVIALVLFVVLTQYF